MEKQVYMNRELSWLKFNERVLEEAERNDVPLCERLSFASIYQSNLDEFFMVRIGSLMDCMALTPDERDTKTNMTSEEQITAALSRIRMLNARKDKVYDELMHKMEAEGVRFVDFRNISEEESARLEKYFDSEIAPLISPFVVGKRHPFPFLKNREIYAAAVLDRKNSRAKIGIIPCGTDVFPRLIEVSAEKHTYMLSEELILHFIYKVFNNYSIREKTLIRLTRNADIDADALYDEDIDYRAFMEEIIKRRRKLAPVRLEITRELNGEIVDTLCEYLEMSRALVFRCSTPLDLSFLFRLRDVLRQKTELFYPKRIPRPSPQFVRERPILDQIKEKDKLLAYPFRSIKPFITMLREAANDDEVVSVKMTLYRVAKQSEIVEALIDAAENGKDVLVLVELKARFDEENNIEWSRRLEAAGCTVIYGLNGYKVHSKLCLITKRVDGKAEYYTQIGTGNYNEKTSRTYTDLSLMTYNQSIGSEVAALFNALSSDTTLEAADELLVAPNCLQNKILDLIEEETKKGSSGYIGVKLNSLTDKKIIDAFIAASKAGVKIDLIVRGICCLLPQVEGETDNIRVISIVGRFLEHSRIYIFGKHNPKMYISSADFMTRNTLRRVEVAVPIYDNDIRNEILDMFRTMLSDNTQARDLLPDGTYKLRTPSGKKINSQEVFYDNAYSQSSFPTPEPSS